MKLKMSVICIGLIVGPAYVGHAASIFDHCSADIRAKNQVFVKREKALLDAWDKMSNRGQVKQRPKLCANSKQRVESYRNHVRFLEGEGVCIGMVDCKAEDVLSREGTCRDLIQRRLDVAVEGMEGDCR